MRKGFSASNFILLLIVIIIFSVSIYGSSWTDKVINVSYPEFVEMIDNDEIESIVIEEGDPYFKAITKDGVTVKANNPNTEQSDNVIYNSGVNILHNKSVSDKLSSFMSFFWLGLVLVLGFSIFSAAKKGGGMSKSMFDEGIDTNVKKPNIRFSDVAGNLESKEAMNELVYYLQNPDKYKKYGIKPPKGAMMFGPPGTGKTLLAKAIAGEANANFLAVTGSDFVDKFVGNGASRVRHLFAEARKLQPCIIFIDEIDAVGGKRGAGMGNEERNQTLLALLSEIDGFSDDEGIIVIGATNRLDSLDEALLRSGRFDTKVYIGLPDLNARIDIFKVHSKNKPIAKDVDYSKLAKMSTYFSGADIENVMNKAGFYAARQNKEFIDMSDIDAAINHLVAGDAKKDRSGISDDDKKLTAYHEAGHAIVAKLLAKVSVPKVTIIPTTMGAGGYTLVDSGEQSYKTKEELLSQIAISAGGRAAEELIFGSDQITTGASGDIKRITELAVNMIANYGMSSEFGMLSLDSANGVSKEILKAAKNIVDNVYSQTSVFLADNKDLLIKLAERLLEVETVLEDELEQLLKSDYQLNLFKKIEEI